MVALTWCRPSHDLGRHAGHSRKDRPTEEKMHEIVNAPNTMSLTFTLTIASSGCSILTFLRQIPKQLVPIDDILWCLQFLNVDGEVGGV